MNSQALVIGGAGFIGSHLCQRLLREGYAVTSLDNYSSGSESRHIAGVRYISGEAREVGRLCKPDFGLVFHLGEYSRVEPSFDNMRPVFLGNLNSIYSVLKFCKDSQAKMIYSGSSSGFSDYEVSNRSPYTFVKQVNVDIIKQYAAWTGIDYAICYFYNVFGPGEVGKGEFCTVVEKFLLLREAGAESAPVTYPGMQGRNFTHVYDIINGIMLVAQKGSGDGYGIGNEQAYSIVELAQLIGLMPELRPATKGNRMSAPLNVSATKMLGWSCEQSLSGYINKRLENVTQTA